MTREKGLSGDVDFEALRNRRTAKLVELMKREGLDALLLNRIENVRYSTDFRPVVSLWFQSSYASVVTSRGDAILLTVAGDYMRSKHYMPWIKDIRVMHVAGRAEEIGDIFREHKLTRVGYDQLNLDEYTALGATGKGVEFVNVNAQVADERAVKLDEEVKLMAKASKVTEVSIRSALASAKPGKREYEISAEGEYAARRLGAEGMSWSLATFSGLNTGLMLRHDSEKVVRNGEFLILGYATMYRGYNTDITSTTIVGRPNEKQKEVYTATYDAFRAALKSTRPGTMTRDIHDAAERVITEYGFGKYSF
ncbi:MAG TPA: Xaa-Pro peptidase family protein, partial [Nitrososphaerales archaeon]|nr:Xaa-Pro peptidase family protein [Nitrososphaerales archaeon]